MPDYTIPRYALLPGKAPAYFGEFDMQETEAQHHALKLIRVYTNFDRKWGYTAINSPAAFEFSNNLLGINDRIIANKKEGHMRRLSKPTARITMPDFPQSCIDEIIENIRRGACHLYLSCDVSQPTVTTIPKIITFDLVAPQLDSYRPVEPLRVTVV